MKQRLILGMDISSACCGLSTVRLLPNGQIDFGKSIAYHPPKKGSINARLRQTRDDVEAILKNDFAGIDEIAIEDLVKIIPGRSNPNTITVLASWNRVLSLLAFDHLGVEPTMISVRTIRAHLKKEKKEAVFNELERLLNVKLPKVFGKRGGESDDTYDMSDATAVAYVRAVQVRDSIVNVEEEADSEFKSDPWLNSKINGEGSWK